MNGRSYQGANEYRYAFNGMEKDDEWQGEGNSYTTQFRQYDPRLGRWRSLDPLMGKFASMSAYAAFGNNPIYFTDPLGLEPGGPEGDPVKAGDLVDIGDGVMVEMDMGDVEVTHGTLQVGDQVNVIAYKAQTGETPSGHRIINGQSSHTSSSAFSKATKGAKATDDILDGLADLAKKYTKNGGSNNLADSFKNSEGRKKFLDFLQMVSVTYDIYSWVDKDGQLNPNMADIAASLGEAFLQDVIGAEVAAAGGGSGAVAVSGLGVTLAVMAVMYINSRELGEFNNGLNDFIHDNATRSFDHLRAYMSGDLKGKNLVLKPLLFVYTSESVESEAIYNVIPTDILFHNADIAEKYLGFKPTHIYVGYPGENVLQNMDGSYSINIDMNREKYEVKMQGTKKRSSGLGSGFSIPSLPK